MEPMTKDQRSWLLLFAMNGHPELSRKELELNRATIYKWRQQEQFKMVEEGIRTGQFSRAEAIAEYLGKTLPRILEDLVEMAVKPWSEVGMVRVKQWAMQMVLDLVKDGPDPAVRGNIFNFSQVINKLKEKVGSQEVVEGPYRLLPGSTADPMPFPQHSTGDLVTRDMEVVS